MELSREEFDMLDSIIEDNVSSFNDDVVINRLIKLGYISSECKVTPLGLKALEPYKVKRAIFLAAGKGERMYPVTLSTPKPLVTINNKRIIDTLLDACINIDIKEIYIVRGYLKEEFASLLDKYPHIKFIDNNNYDIENNISSIYLVREYLSNSYVFESDLYLYNDKLIRKYHYQSNFLGIYKENSDDWCLYTKDNIIINEQLGGSNCYQMVGISYWSNIDFNKLKKDIEEVYISFKEKQLFWEQVPLQIKNNHYKVEIRECYQEDVIELDSVDDLIKVDSSYKKIY